MRIFDGIIKWFSRRETKKLESGEEEPEQISTSNREEFKQNYKHKKQINVEEFYGLEPMEKIDKIIRSIEGINPLFLSNPRTYNSLAESVIEIGQHIRKIKFDNKKYISEGEEIEKIYTEISESWGIKPDGILIRHIPEKTNKSIYNKDTNIKLQDDNFIIEETEYGVYEDRIKSNGEKADNSKTIDIHYYNTDGIEIKRIEKKESIKNGEFKSSTSLIERETLDRAKFIMDNGKVYNLDLVYDRNDIADLYAYTTDDERDVFNKYETNVDEKERAEDIQKAISESKYSKGCKKMYEKESKNKSIEL